MGTAKQPITGLGMTFSGEAISLTAASTWMLFMHRSEFLISLAIALLLSAGCWYGATHFSRLWNLRFKASFFHGILCLSAAVLTFIFVMLFASFRYLKPAADASIEAWRAGALLDQGWSQAAYAQAYNAVKALGIEDFSHAPTPDQPGSIVPLTKLESKEKYADVFASAAVEDFKASRPLLSRIVWMRFAVPQETVASIQGRMKDFFLTVSSTIPLDTVVEYTAEAIKASLDEGTTRVVPVARGVLIALFVLVQSIPFALIGWAAWRDLKVTV